MINELKEVNLSKQFLWTIVVLPHHKNMLLPQLNPTPELYPDEEGRLVGEFYSWSRVCSVSATSSDGSPLISSQRQDRQLGRANRYSLVVR